MLAAKPALCAAALLLVLAGGVAAEAEKPRLIILADMGNEPDEEQQMIHMLVNSNEFDLEGLIAVTGKYLNERSKHEYRRQVHPELFHRLIDGYAQVEANLRLHAEGWPTADALHAIVRRGQEKYGIADTGPGKTSGGSELIAASLLRDDRRPLNVVVNAGSNTLAQALIDLREQRTPAEMKRLVTKLRVYENGAQDNAGAWICHEFPTVHWIRSNHQTYGYMGQGNGVGPHTWAPHPRTNQGQHRWAEQHIMRGHGALGELYPYRFGGKGFLEGGGTVPWLGLVNKGLYAVDHPSWGGWSGRFTTEKQDRPWSRHESVSRDEKNYGAFRAYTDASDAWTDPHDGAAYDNEYAPVWRWRQAINNNCIARFGWCVKPVEQANHHPVAVVNGDDSNAFLFIDAVVGEKLSFDASASTDQDGDELTYRWYVYPEAGTHRGAVELQTEGSACSLTAPAELDDGSLHLILEVTDAGAPALTDYRRVVIAGASER